MARGGKREGAGRPKGVPLPPRPDKSELTALLEALDAPAKPNEPYRIAKWRELTEAQDLRIRLDARKYLTDQCYGKATQPIDHGGAMDHTIIFDMPGPAREKSR